MKEKFAGFKFIRTFAIPSETEERTIVSNSKVRGNIGELAEWSNAAVLKTVDLNGSGGSNPSLSADKRKLQQK